MQSEVAVRRELGRNSKSGAALVDTNRAGDEQTERGGPGNGEVEGGGTVNRKGHGAGADKSEPDGSAPQELSTGIIVVPQSHDDGQDVRKGGPGELGTADEVGSLPSGLTATPGSPTTRLRFPEPASIRRVTSLRRSTSVRSLSSVRSVSWAQPPTFFPGERQRSEAYLQGLRVRFETAEKRRRTLTEASGRRARD